MKNRDVLVVLVCALMGCQASQVSEAPKQAPAKDQDLRLTAGGFIEDHPEGGAVNGVCTSETNHDVLDCDIYNGLVDWTVTEITLGVTWFPYTDDDKRYFRETVFIEPLKTSRVSIRLGLQLPEDEVIRRRSKPPVTLNHWSWLITGARGLPK